MNDLVTFLERPEAWAFYGTVATAILGTWGNWLVRRRREAREENIEKRRVKIEEHRFEMDDRETAFRQLLEVVQRLRDEVKSVREDLNAERIARQDAQSMVETLKNEVKSLRDRLRRCELYCPAHSDVMVSPDAKLAND